ncbi:MAG: glutaminyl-peptide cyclotransferase [Anaerolineae bacterium]|nr:glutaminyl-peptide cyclotransferase [Anaerolineae bacterium]
MGSGEPRRTAGWVSGAAIWLSVAGWIALGSVLTACSAAPTAPWPAATPASVPTATAAAGLAPTGRPAILPTPTATLQPAPAAITYTYAVVNVYPHDPGAFTQGLVYADGVLYESTGLNGRSSLRRVALETGEVLQRRDLAPEYFGEGLALFNDRLIQLTWQNNIGFVYDANSFEPLQTWAYPTEGWGLTHDGTHLIMSDGSATLRFLDPYTFAVQREVMVTDGGRPVARLNELEYINGEVFANVWMTDWIARIDPHTGRVLGWVDLSGLLAPEERAGTDVLNGIAYDPQGGRLFVTGKLWPKLFEITLVPQP